MSDLVADVSAASGEPVEQRLGRHRAGHEVALTFLTTKLTQMAIGELGLNAFGTNAEAKALGYGDDVTQQKVLIAGLLERADEGLVNLEHVGGDVSDIGKIGIAGAEIIQRDIHSRLAQAAELFDRTG